MYCFPTAKSLGVFLACSQSPIAISGMPATLPPPDPLMSWVSEAVKTRPTKHESSREWELNFESLQILRPIGEGSFGRVYAATLAGEPVAVKILIDPSAARPDDIHDVDTVMGASSTVLSKLYEEVDIMKKVSHPNVIRFVGVCTYPPCIVTELCARGSLADVLNTALKSPEAAAELGWRRRLAIAIDAADGLAYLHQQEPPVVHRDLKSANLLINENWQAKVSDFNLSKILDASTRSTSLAAMNPRWLAPETLNGERASPACDVFALGVVMWELMTCEVPWGSTNPWHIVSTIQQGKRLSIPTREKVLGGTPSYTFYRRYVVLMEKCWAQNPEDRPHIADVARELRTMAAANDF